MWYETYSTLTSQGRRNTLKHAAVGLDGVVKEHTRHIIHYNIFTQCCQPKALAPNWQTRQRNTIFIHVWPKLSNNVIGIIHLNQQSDILIFQCFFNKIYWFSNVSPIKEAIPLQHHNWRHEQQIIIISITIYKPI